VATTEEQTRTETALPVVVAFFAAFRRLMRSFRLYGEGHENCVAQVQRTAEAAVAMADSGPVELAVLSTSIRLGERVLLEDEPQQDALVGSLFADGVTALVFVPGLDVAEAEVVFGCWWRAVAQRFQSDDDFVTTMWERALPHVEVKTAGVLSDFGGDGDGGDGRGQLETLMDAMTTSERTAGSRSIVAARTLLDDARPLAIAQEILDRQGAAERIVDAAADAPARAALLEGLRRDETAQQRSLLFTTLYATWGAVADDPVGAALLDEVVIDLAAALVDARRTAELAQGLGRCLATDPRSTFSQHPPSEFVARVLGSPRVLPSLVRQLDDPATCAVATACLRALPVACAGDLLDAFAATSTSTGQAAFVDLVVAVGPGPELVVAALRKHPAAVVPCLRIARAFGASHLRVVAAAALGGADSVVVPALRELKPGDVALVRDVVVRIVDARQGASPARRAAAVALLVRARDGAVVPELAARVRDRGLSVDERRAALSALTVIGTPPACAALRACFTAETNGALKGGIALALGKLGDVEARPLLVATLDHGGLFKALVQRELKDAVREALRRLDDPRRGGDRSTEGAPIDDDGGPHG
jgi:hypothetical protein